MLKIYSKIHPDLLLHLIVTESDFAEGRNDIAHNNDFLQCALLHMNQGKTFKPHKHIWKKGPENIIAQESWVCLKGSVKCIFYDLNDIIIAEPVLKQGDISMSFLGGHNYEILEDNTIVAEFKSGPYHGQLKDKEFINA